MAAGGTWFPNQSKRSNFTQLLPGLWNKMRRWEKGRKLGGFKRCNYAKIKGRGNKTSQLTVNQLLVSTPA